MEGPSRGHPACLITVEDLYPQNHEKKRICCQMGCANLLMLSQYGQSEMVNSGQVSKFMWLNRVQSGITVVVVAFC